MPKIIENLRTDILEKALEIIHTEGIDKLNIRHLSSELGIAPSTVYNYYKSKEEILGAVAMERWQKTLEDIDSLCASALDEREILSQIADRLRDFFKPLFAFHISSMKDSSANSKTAADHRDNYQQEISSQLREKIEKLLLSRNHSPEEAAEMSGILTGLIIACMHNDKLNIKGIAGAMAKLK